MDLSASGRVGTRQAGMLSVGNVTGNGGEEWTKHSSNVFGHSSNGAGWSVPYVGGTTGPQFSWGSASIPTTFTICSIRRYSGAGKDRNGSHGHWGHSVTYAGATITRTLENLITL
jgi:hypothetical protein